ncbi:MAG TPA: hypothetical protein VE439_09105, partial [Anaerolineae bacterium]|nr:hypothetical protein [Anaerolineae bacterium]
WIISGNLFIGLILISVVPSFIWAFFPVYATMTGAIAVDPFAFVRYLPAMALVSAGCLIINQVRVAHRNGKEPK